MGRIALVFVDTFTVCNGLVKNTLNSACGTYSEQRLASTLGKLVNHTMYPKDNAGTRLAMDATETTALDKQRSHGLTMLTTWQDHEPSRGDVLSMTVVQERHPACSVGHTSAQ